MRPLLVWCFVAGVAVAQQSAARTADSFIPARYVGELSVDVTALRAAGLLDELRVWIEKTPAAELEPWYGFAFEDMHRVRVFVGVQQGGTEDVVADLDARVAIFEGNEKMVLPAAGDRCSVAKLAGYDALLLGEHSEDPGVRVVVAPGVMLYGKRSLVEPLLTNAVQPGRTGARRAEAAGLFAAVVPLPGAANDDRLPRVVVVRCSRDGDRKGLVLEATVRFEQPGDEVAAAAESVREQVVVLQAMADFAPLHPALARLSIRVADADVIGRIEFASLGELLDALAALPLVAERARAAAAAARVQLARTHLRAIYDAAKLHRLEHGCWPMLAELAAPDARGKRMLDEVPRDPWGHDYVLHEVEGKLRVLCVGPDGVEGTTDDLLLGR